MLCTNTTNRITFKVGIHGTAALPTVRCMVGAEPALCFIATNIGGESWEALIKLPEDFPTGVQPFRVEVQLNGRLFTPITKEINITRKEDVESKVTVSQVSTPDIVPPGAEPVVTPTATIEPPKPRIDAAIVPRTTLPEAPAPAPAIAPAPTVSVPPAVQKIKLDLASIANATRTESKTVAPIRTTLPKAPELAGLKGLKEAKPVPLAPRAEPPASQPVLQEATPAAPVEQPVEHAPETNAKQESAQLTSELINSLSKVAEAIKPSQPLPKISVPKAPALKGLSSFMIAAPVKIPSKIAAPVVEDIKISIADIANEALDSTK
jgi:hypothetical protein